MSREHDQRPPEPSRPLGADERAEAIASEELINRLLEGKCDGGSAETGAGAERVDSLPPPLPDDGELFEPIPGNRVRAGRRGSRRGGFLPEWFLPKPGPRDRWAHRRGEPRTFAFLWTLYLLLATVAMFWKVLRVGAPTLDIYRPAMQLLLLSAAVGATVIWPMVRLCQEAPAERRWSHVWADVAVIMLPFQAVLWPQVLLAQWSGAVVLAVDLLLGAWVVLMGVLVLAGWERRGWWRALPLALGILLLGAGPLVGMASRAVGSSGSGLGDWWMSSPFTGILELTRVEQTEARRGIVDEREWALIGLTWVGAIVSWGLARLAGIGRSRGRGGVA